MTRIADFDSWSFLTLNRNLVTRQSTVGGRDRQYSELTVHVRIVVGNTRQHQVRRQRPKPTGGSLETLGLGRPRRRDRS